MMTPCHATSSDEVCSGGDQGIHGGGLGLGRGHNPWSQQRVELDQTGSSGHAGTTGTDTSLITAIDNPMATKACAYPYQINCSEFSPSVQVRYVTYSPNKVIRTLAKRGNNHLNDDIPTG